MTNKLRENLSTARTREELIREKVSFDPHIDFGRGSTDTVARHFYEFSQDKQFTLLALGTGHGKTAIGIHASGVMANERGHTQKNPLKIILVANRAIVDSEQWDKTFEQYYHHGEHGDKILHTHSFTYDRISSFRTTDTTHTKEWKLRANNKDESRAKQYRKRQKEQGREITLKQAIDEFFERNERTRWQEMRDERVSFQKDFLSLLDENTIIIIDEVHNLKNPTTNRGKWFTRAVRNSKAFGLTATPMANGLVDDGMGYLVYNGYYTSKSNLMNRHIPFQYLDKYYQPDVFFRNGDIDPNRFLYLDEYKQMIDETIFMPNIPIDFELPDTSVFTHSYQLNESTSRTLSELAKNYRERKYDNYMEYLSDVRGTIAKDIEHRRELVRLLMSKDDVKQPLIFYSTNAELGDDPNKVWLEKQEYSKAKLRHALKSNILKKLLQKYGATEFDTAEKHIQESILNDWHNNHRAKFEKQISVEWNKVVQRDFGEPDLSNRNWVGFLANDIENKGILWSLAKMGKPYGIINGQHSIADLDRENLNQAIVIQYRAGGAGIEFPKSNLSIFYGLNYSWQDTQQAMGRNVRRGRSHRVDMYFMISSSPHDVRVWDVIERKRDFTEEEMKQFADDLANDYAT